MKYAILTAGTKIPLSDKDYKTIEKKLTRYVDQNIILQNGDLISTAHIIFLGTEQEPAKQAPKAKK